ncbi:hypothetical protein [Photobacterium sanguinicancri]|uniref:Uncharacterized protein n=1 Tax=Photobacterium sanguinicancri TaxID=875932 RepID=A0AAW7YA37_9GAMM|nr:hypothetical protein [Photobacterium sanguinicancri]MDO6545528.1 hypothetical protein [Photobacterium sanguinicancri]
METYWLARDLNGVPLGRHQFIVILTGNSPRAFRLKHSKQTLVSRKIGTQFGLVLGAQNVKPTNGGKFNRLIVVPFEKADMASAVEHFGGAPSHLSKQFAYKKAEAKRVYPRKDASESDLVNAIIKAVDFYIVNESSQPIAYPPPWLGKNSNSWANSVLDAAPTSLPTDPRERVKAGDFFGADAAHDIRINQMYFRRICKPCIVENPAYR